MCVILLFLFFFFKQKTAYEMRISDWSSDVCSSDLPAAGLDRFGSREFRREFVGGIGREIDRDERIERHAEVDAARRAVDERGFGDHLAARGAHRLHRFARRETGGDDILDHRSEEHTSELQSLMRISYAVFCLKKKKDKQ